MKILFGIGLDPSYPMSWKKITRERGMCMWQLSQPWWEFVVRGVIVYGFIFILLRVIGRRQIGQLTPFDFVLLLIISNAVQNSMNAGDNTITAGLILALTLVAMNVGINYLMFRYRKVEIFLDGRPLVLVHNGVIFSKAMESDLLTRQDLDTALHKEGVENISDVHYAILEPSGQITVLTKKDKK